MLSISEVRTEITHCCDGPLTPFVLMCRAFDLVEAGRTTADNAANGLYEALAARKWIAGDDDDVGLSFEQQDQRDWLLAS